MKSSTLIAAAVFMFVCNVLVAQNRQVDSLKTLYNNSKKDTTRVNLLLALSKINFNVNPDETVRYGKEAWDLAKTLKYNKGIALAHKHIGIGYFNKGMYIDALQQYEQSLATYEKIGDKRGMASMLKNTGNIYFNQGDDDKALEYYLKSLKLSEEISDTLQLSSSLINIGAVYTNKVATHDKAFQYYRRAYALNRLYHDNTTLGAITVNMGELFMASEQYDSALYYLKISLKAYESTLDVAYTMNNIGKVYVKQKKYDRAIDILQQSLGIAKDQDSQYDVTISLFGLAECYQAMGNMTTALSYFKEAEQHANTIGAKYSLRDIYDGLTRTYAKLEDYEDAFKYQTLLGAVKDTIYNLESDKKLGTLQFTYDLEKKGAQINLLTKDSELKAKEIETQKLMRNGFMGGFAIVLLFAGVFLLQRNKISHEKKRSEALLLNILPAETAHELKLYGKTKARRYDSVTVLFTDFKGFSTLAETMTPEALVDVIDHYFRAFDRIIKPFGIEKIKTIGDSYMCACGLPTLDANHAIKAVQAALAIREFVAKDAIHRGIHELTYFDIRIGVHSGPVVAGIVGESKFAYDIWGDTVNMASRMESSGAPGKVNISGETYQLVKDRFECVHRGKVNVKHKDDVEMYFVEQEVNAGLALEKNHAAHTIS